MALKTLEVVYKVATDPYTMATGFDSALADWN